MEKTKVTDPKVTYALPHKYLGMFGIVWICFLIINCFASVKTFSIYGLIFSVGNITYPVTYIFSDIFTEVYGFRSSRKIIWTGFVSFFLITTTAYFYSLIPSDPSFSQVQNEAFNTVFRLSPVLVFISLMSFSSGEFTNSITLAKMKVWTNGKSEGLRYIVSTLFGQTIDNGTFYILSFLLLGWYTLDTLPNLLFTTVIFCTGVEVIMLPVTKRVINFIKEQEGIDTYDRGTDFNPLKF